MQEKGKQGFILLIALEAIVGYIWNSRLIILCGMSARIRQPDIVFGKAARR